MSDKIATQEYASYVFGGGGGSNKGITRNVLEANHGSLLDYSYIHNYDSNQLVKRNDIVGSAYNVYQLDVPITISTRTVITLDPPIVFCEPNHMVGIYWQYTWNKLRTRGSNFSICFDSIDDSGESFSCNDTNGWKEWALAFNFATSGVDGYTASGIAKTNIEYSGYLTYVNGELSGRIAQGSTIILSSNRQIEWDDTKNHIFDKLVLGQTSNAQSGCTITYTALNIEYT